MNRLQSARLFAIAMLAVGMNAVADSSDERSAEAQALVASFVNDVTTFSGAFEQILLDANGALLETSTGRLDIARPGRFRWAYDEPYEQWLIADGLNIWSYDLDLAQATVKPQDEALANTPAMLLGGAGNAMDEFVIEPVEAAAEPGSERAPTVWVRLMPVNPDSGFRYVDLGFIDETLHRMVFLDSLEQTTVVNLTDVRVDVPIEDATFRFSAPDDVDVVGTPATADDS